MLKAAMAGAGLSQSGMAQFFGGLQALAQDQDLLDTAHAQIARHRQSDGVVVVKDRAGQLVSGAIVQMEQLRHEFQFGCNLFRFEHNSDDRAESAYRSRFAEVFNYATLGFYWKDYEAKRGSPQYLYSDRAAAWCSENHIACKGHPLVWDDPASVPAWLPIDITETAQLSLARVTECVSRFRGRIDIWDVVNEPTTLGRYQNPIGAWARAVGGLDYARRSLEAARVTNPRATLLVNDFTTDGTLIELLRPLLAAKPKLLDAVGIQSHMHKGVWPLRRIWEVCDAVGALGLPLHFTEMTVVSGQRRGPGYEWNSTNRAGEAQQADYVTNLYTMLFAHRAVAAVTWWDFTDDNAWQGAPAGWLRRDMSPKPVYERLHNLIKGKWWTRVRGRTNSNGEFGVRAFRGAHRVRVTPPSGRSTVVDAAWSAGNPNRIEVMVGS
jgi:GH35 family endo-1,4-beta-xylanase